MSGSFNIERKCVIKQQSGKNCSTFFKFTFRK